MKIVSEQIWLKAIRMVCIFGVSLGSTPCIYATGDASAEHVAGMSDDQLEWLFSGINGQWNQQMLEIARLFSQEQPAKAEGVLDLWLQNDFEQAMFMLPSMAEMFSFFEGHDMGSIYAQHLERYTGAERMEILAMFNTSNFAIRHVGVAVMANWWQQDREEMTQWIQRVPCFFEESFYESFVKKIQARGEDPALLAALFMSLEPLDFRRTLFLDQVLEDWMQVEPAAAVAFIEDAHLARGDRQDMSIDRLVWKVSYYFANQSEYAQALQWAARVYDTELREIAVRDHSLSVTSQADKYLFLDWIKSYSIQSDELRHEILDQLNSIDELVADHSEEGHTHD